MVEDIVSTTLLNQSVQIEGPTLFSGVKTKISITTDNDFDGIYFKRIDRQESSIIKACLDNIHKTPRTTILGEGPHQILLIEHLMATLYAFGIRKALIEVDGPEIPIGDGSAIHFVNAIESVGIKKLATRSFQTLGKTCYLELQNQTLLAIPANEFRSTYVLNYPGHPLLDFLSYTFTFSLQNFIKQIAQARTFALKSEVDHLVSHGFIKGNCLDFGIVIDQEKVLNPQGLRFQDEMARHKILDFLGDFALADLDLSMHNVSIRSGHQANIDFARKIKNQLKSDSYGT